MRAIFYFVLIAAFGNVVLRMEMEDPYTLYRILSPLVLLFFFLVRPMIILKSFFVFFIFLLYSFLLAYFYMPDFTQFVPSVLHYFYLFILLVLMLEMKARYIDFDEGFMRFMGGVYVFLVLNLLVEFLFGNFYPNLYVDETGESFVRAFFWNQNDLAVVLCVFAWFVLCLDRYRGLVRTVVVLLTIIILFYNDSKAALLSFLFVSLPIYALVNVRALVRLAGSVWFVFFCVLFFSFVSFLIIASDVEIRFANDVYTIGDLLIRPALDIFYLRPTGEVWGSLNNRTDAAIFVIIEYLRTFGFGLGPGGSWLVLSLPEYTLGGAQSPHNALLQFIVDFGYPVLLGYLYLIFWALRKLFGRRMTQNEMLKVMAILSFPLLGLSQSGAILTNFFFFSLVLFICLMDKEAVFVGAQGGKEKTTFSLENGAATTMVSKTS